MRMAACQLGGLALTEDAVVVVAEAHRGTSLSPRSGHRGRLPDRSARPTCGRMRRPVRRVNTLVPAVRAILDVLMAQAWRQSADVSVLVARQGLAGSLHALGTREEGGAQPPATMSMLLVPL